MARISCALFVASIAVVASDVTAQFVPPFIPLTGLVSTSAVRNEMKVYRAKLAAVKNEGDMMETSDIDLEHAKDCADHFGKCSVRGIEEMRKKLHSERVASYLTGETGLNSPLGPEAELGRRLLEEDLSLQLSLLQDELPNSKLVEDDFRQYVPHVTSGTPDPVAVKQPDENHHYHMDVMVGNEWSDAAMICACIAVVAFAPHLLK
jgi:hypothetical protein